MEELVGRCNNTGIMENVENAELCGEVNVDNSLSSGFTSKSCVNGEPCEKLQKIQLPNAGSDDSPFVNFKANKMRKKKTQSKLTYLKVSAGTTTRKMKNVTTSKFDCKNIDENPQCKEVSLTTSALKDSSPDCSQNNDSTKQEAQILVCPVCWKNFETEGKQMAHIKTCATKHNLTLKQFLDALELQTKQIEERRILGLPCVPTNVKKSIPKKSSGGGDVYDPDLQLGLALSVSIEESKEQDMIIEQEIMMEAGLGNEVAANQASLLERFGFTSTRPVLPSVQPRLRPGKRKLSSTPLLLLRTREEQERLITEKVAIVLTSDEEENGFVFCLNDYGVVSHDSKLKSEVLSDLQNKDGSLWRKASTSPSSKDFNTYYVELLSHIVTPSKLKAGNKLKHLSQVPCRLKTPERNYPTTADNCNANIMQDSLEDVNDSSCDEQSQQDIMSRCENREGNRDVYEIDTVNNIMKNESCKFIHQLANDWEQLFTSGYKSDLSICVKSGMEIPVHEVVLYVRCPNILNDVIQRINNTGTYIRCIMWNEISFQCALAFLDFLYCGSTCKIHNLKDIDEIVCLCSKYDFQELFNYLKHCEKEKINSLQYTCKEKDNGSLICDEFKGRTNGFDLHSSITNERTSLCKYTIKTPMKHMCRLSNSEENVNADKSNKDDEGSISKSVSSSQSDDLIYKSCPSPDPFLDDDNMNSVLCNRRDLSSNTQQNIDYILEVLDNDDDDDDDDINEKRKLSDSDNLLESKRICMDNRESSRKSSRKSLLDSFSGEERNVIKCDKDVIKFDLNKSSNSSNSNDSVSFIQSVSVKNSDSLHKDDVILQCDKTEISGREASEYNVCNVETNKLTAEGESIPMSYIQNKSQYIQDENGKMFVMCGDISSDNKRQDFPKNYSPSRLISPLKTMKLCMTKRMKVVKKSLFSFPASVKSLSGGDSPVLSQEKDTESDSVKGSISSPIALRTPEPLHTRIPQTIKTSVKSLKHLLEDSFTYELEKNNCFSLGDYATCSTPVATESGIPTKQLKGILQEENCVTPLTNYSTMDTPRLKKELEKYGLKPLKRKRAKQMLRHIYNELHPLVPAHRNQDEVLTNENDPDISRPTCSTSLSRGEAETKISPEPKHKRERKKIFAASPKNETDAPSEDESSLPTTQESFSSSLYEFGSQEDLIADDALTQTDESELPMIVHNCIINNPVLHEQMLLFEPISLEQLQDELRAQNYKFKLNHLMEYLDEQCIMYRGVQGNKRKRKQKKEKPKK